MNPGRKLTPSTMWSGPMLTPEHKRQLRLVSRAQVVLDEACAAPGEDVQGFPPIIARHLTQLTYKQRHFALLYANGTPATVAYRTAYNVSEERSDADIAAESFTIRTNPKVQQSIELVENWINQKWLLEAADAKDWALSKLYDEATTASKASDRIKATELILRAHGGLTDKKEIIHRDGKDVDNAAAALASVLDSLGMTIDASYSVQNQQVETPSIGVVTCPRCSGAVNATFEDGAGI